MENEIMNYEEAMEPEIEMIEEKESSISTGLAMLIGAGLTLAATAAVKLGKKAYNKIKNTTKKDSDLVDEHDFMVPTDEEIEAVTK